MRELELLALVEPELPEHHQRPGAWVVRQQEVLVARQQEVPVVRQQEVPVVRPRLERQVPKEDLQLQV